MAMSAPPIYWDRSSSGEEDMNGLCAHVMHQNLDRALGEGPSAPNLHTALWITFIVIVALIIKS